MRVRPTGASIGPRSERMPTGHVVRTANEARRPALAWSAIAPYVRRILDRARLNFLSCGFYGVSKVAGEALCRLYADKFGLSTISVRIGSYENRPTSAREQRTWLSPSDAVRAFIAAMTTTEHTALFYAVSANTAR